MNNLRASLCNAVENCPSVRLHDSQLQAKPTFWADILWTFQWLDEALQVCIHDFVRNQRVLWYRQSNKLYQTENQTIAQNIFFQIDIWFTWSALSFRCLNNKSKVLSGVSHFPIVPQRPAGCFSRPKYTWTKLTSEAFVGNPHFCLQMNSKVYLKQWIAEIFYRQTSHIWAAT